jgi:competence protein ComEA
MRTLHSHKFSAVLFSLLLVASGVISGCSTRTQQSISYPTEPNPRAININSASAGELERLPHIGRVLAERIVEHRSRYGPFRRTEHILAIEGISEKRYRELQQFIDTK